MDVLRDGGPSDEARGSNISSVRAARKIKGGRATFKNSGKNTTIVIGANIRPEHERVCVKRIALHPTRPQASSQAPSDRPHCAPEVLGRLFQWIIVL